LARLAHKEGDVVLIMTIDEQGIPTEVRVASGDVIFRNDAIRAAQQWRFTPANLDGRPHSARFRLTLQFRLRG
jgi:TonB family protein